MNNTIGCIEAWRRPLFICDMGYAFHELPLVASGSPFVFVPVAYAAFASGARPNIWWPSLPILFDFPRCLSFLSSTPSLCRDAAALFTDLIALTASTSSLIFSIPLEVALCSDSDIHSFQNTSKHCPSFAQFPTSTHGQPHLPRPGVNHLITSKQRNNLSCN